MAHSSILSFIALILLLIALSQAQPPAGNGRDGEDQGPVDAGTAVFDGRMGLNCAEEEFRRFDGACTNRATPLRQLFGSTRLPQFSYFGRRSSDRIRDNVRSLPSPRLISNIVAKQTMDVRERRGLNELVTFFGQFIDHTLVATPVNNGASEDGETVPREPFFIDVPEDDPMLANITGGQLRFFRSRRATVEERSTEVRPINSLTSLLDLDSVYGASEERAGFLRTNSGGLMRVGRNNLLPQNSMRLSNEPRLDRKFFVAGDLRSNEHPMLTSIHTIFLREHNDIATELQTTFPDFNDERLYQTARQINIAQFQKIVFDEWYPAITGRRLPLWRRFQANVDPAVSVLFSTAAFRIGHTLVNNVVSRQRSGNRNMRPLTLQDTFFSNVNLILNTGIDSFLRGAANTRAQEVDLMVVDALRNFLFTNVNGADGLDLIALNLQRSRDHGVPFYNDVRARFRRGNRARTFADITRNTNVQSALQTAYGSVDNVEAWIGLMAEDKPRVSSMGPTMLAIWVREFIRIRDGDSFYYENMSQYDPEVLANVPRLRAIFNGQDTMRALLLRHTGITNGELPSRTFFAN
ncbi:Animal heme peroxidase homologue [Chondrus crispus]|uniref:Animal heme peroxidase homologue n=1 Tax=Chondrus crispus TaxID=2769 RepID=R7QV32_CHOCR|nr:Animal heme peroxidase homologue [Chondrus crispus]CDF41220.1 Animal heme peroxidase homologue [Chondrus crispus]|eukprot:XP_005711514.1 Animal heme peroxidase homologue [Chondrus crispus]